MMAAEVLQRDNAVIPRYSVITIESRVVQDPGITMNELETTMTQKGQVTIPAAIRARLGLRAKDRVRFEVDGDEVKLRPASSRLLAGFGAVIPRQQPEDWHEVEDTVEHLMAAEVAAED